MMFLDTKMHVIVFCITIFEVVMLFFQIIYYLERPNDAQRLRYLILLVLLIAYNTCSGGVMPDDRIPIPIVVQNIAAYFLGFAVSMFAIFFYYKLFDLERLKFLATYGLFIYLFMSFLVFVALYLITGDLALSRKITMIIPFFYGVRFVAKATRSLLVKIKESKQQHVITDTLYLAITAYFSMTCWATLPIINFIGDYQLVEHSVTNLGFMLMSIFYIRSVTLPGSEMPAPPAHPQYANVFRESPSPREFEVLPLLAQGLQYKEIADKLNISERTVSKHASSLYTKAGVTNKGEFINKLGHLNWQAKQHNNHSSAEGVVKRTP